MIYTVVWTRLAERRLAQIWLAASDRQAVTTAANQMDALLRSNAQSAGESRDMGARVLTVGPLTIYFDVSDADRRAVVWSIWASQPT